MKVNESTLALIHNLEVTADKIVAVTSTENRVKIKWSGINALELVELMAHTFHATYHEQTDEFKQRVSYEQFTSLLTHSINLLENPNEES